MAGWIVTCERTTQTTAPGPASTTTSSATKTTVLTSREKATLNHGIDKFNAAAKAEAAKRNFTWIDLTAVSTRPATPTGWLAPDNLHPGDEQYAAWAELIWTEVQAVWTRP